MKKILALFILGCVFTLSGCEQKVTDVGNPTVNLPEPLAQTPSLDANQLVGNYRLPSTQNEGGGAPDVAGGSKITPQCKSDPNAEKSVSLGLNAGEIILENFLSYSENTKKLVVNYNRGVISFEHQEPTLNIKCAGEATLFGGQVSVLLDCQVNSVGCAIAFQKK